MKGPPVLTARMKKVLADTRISLAKLLNVTRRRMTMRQRKILSKRTEMEMLR